MRRYGCDTYWKKDNKKTEGGLDTCKEGYWRHRGKGRPRRILDKIIKKDLMINSIPENFLKTIPSISKTNYRFSVKETLDKYDAISANHVDTK
ncbi:hypothetical protein CR513_06581, partial [Mucuna pruriens]